MNSKHFKNWIKHQNKSKQFASSISNGTTVYFSDEFAAAYDLRIIGKGDNKKIIIVQNELENSPDFQQIAIDTWTSTSSEYPPYAQELWYLQSKLEWIVIANQHQQKKYTKEEWIQSECIDFEFKLSQVSIIQTALPNATKNKTLVQNIRQEDLNSKKAFGAAMLNIACGIPSFLIILGTQLQATMSLSPRAELLVFFVALTGLFAGMYYLASQDYRLTIINNFGLLLNVFVLMSLLIPLIF